MVYNYKNCPVCGEYWMNQDKCPKCGFNQISIDKENDSDLPVIMNQIKKNIKSKKWYKRPYAILIMGNLYDYKDFLSCELVDNKSIIVGKTYSKSRISTADGIMSGINMMAGKPDWASAISTSADRVVTTVKEPDKIKHNFIIYLNTNKIEEPLIKLYLGSNEGKARETLALINAIISQNK